MKKKYRGLPGSSQGIVHSVIIGCLFAAAVVGLIAVTNFATSRMAVSAARTSARSSGNAESNPDTQPQTDLTPKSQLGTVQTDSEYQTDAGPSKSPSSNKCDLTAEKHVVASFATLVKSENSLHKHNIADIISHYQTTGLLTRVLNPGMVSTRLTSENLRHQQAVKSLVTKRTAEIAAVHC